MLHGLDYIPGGLSVTYQASQAPQRVIIEARLRQPPTVPWGPSSLPLLCDTINAGGAGGALFPPTLGSAELLSGPRGTTPDAMAMHCRWELSLCGVSPRFIRTIVERLRLPPDGWVVESLIISGETPLDGSPLSLRESTLVRWLDEPGSYPELYPELPFQVVDSELFGGAGIRLSLQQPTTIEVVQQLTRTIELFHQAVQGFVSRSEQLQGEADVVPRVSCGRNELSVGYDVFDFTQMPARATLLNMLSAFHERVCPITQAHLALS